MPLIDSSDAELDAFDAVCRRLGGFDDRVVAEWADGYLTALAAGPRAMTLDEALPRLAGDAFERAFGDPDDVAQGRQALQSRLRVLANHLDAEALLDQPEALRLQPLVSLWDAEARAALAAANIRDASAYLFVVQGDLELAGGNFKEARTAYRRAYREGKNLVEALLGLARVERALGNEPAAQRALRKALKIRPDDPQVQALLGSS